MGLEVVVRPVLLPNIRPVATRALSIADAPDKGIATISGGSGGSVISLPHTESHSWSTSRMVEVRRKYDKARMYYTNPDGTIDYSTYWEFEVLRSVEYLENGKYAIGQQFAPTIPAPNIDILARNLSRSNNQ